MTTQHRLGWIGLGRMGFAMAERLLKAKHDVAVWNRTREKALPLAERGARLVDGKAALGACDIVFTMVSTTDDLKEVLFGAGGLLSGGAKPKLVCDSSSISRTPRPRSAPSSSSGASTSCAHRCRATRRWPRRAS